MSRYDIEKFEPPPDPDLVCCICQCVLDKAVESPCRHVFCQVCIERWLTNRHTCPTCRKRTKKQDLKPVLPLVQNMLNRLVMKCDNLDNGCLEKIMLEQFEKHVQNCGYETKTCRFSKCGKKILKMHLNDHEREICEHRESVCEGECGLMIALSDRLTHNCVAALKAHIEEKNRMIETLKTKLQELNNLSQSLNDQLEQLRQQLDDNRPRLLSISSFSGSDSDVTDFMSGTLSDESLFDDTSNQSTQNVNDNMEDASGNNAENTNTASDVVEQVERTIVTTLFDVSSRLEVVRNQMRAVLDAGFVNDNDNLHFATPALDAIVNNNSNVGSAPNNSVANNNNNSHNGNNGNELNSERFMQTLNSLISNTSDNSDNGEQSSEALDGDVNPELQNRSTSIAEYSDFASDQESRDASFSDHTAYENSDSNHSNSHSEDSDINWILSDDVRHDDSEVQEGNSSYASNNQSSTEYCRDERSISEHVIVSEPPDSPSNSSFSSSSSSIPTISSVNDSPASRRSDSPKGSSTPRADSAYSFWRSGPDTPESMHSSVRGTSSLSQRSFRSNQESSPTLMMSDIEAVHDSRSGYESENNTDNNRSIASHDFYSEQSHIDHVDSTISSDYDSKSSVSSRLSHHNASGENSNECEVDNCAIEQAESETPAINQNITNNTSDNNDKQAVSMPLERPVYIDPSEDESNPARLSDGQQLVSNQNISMSEKSLDCKGFQSDSCMQRNSSGSSTDEVHHSVPVKQSDSSEESDESESIKYLTKRLKHVKREVREVPDESRSETKWNKAESDRNGVRSGKTETIETSEVNNDKCKSESNLKVRNTRKRRIVTDSSYLGSQCKKSNSTVSFGSVSQTSLQQKSLPSQTVTSSDQGQLLRRTRSNTVQATASAQDNNSQSLNVKIDLSLINYSGQVMPQSVNSSGTNAMVTANLSSVNKNSGTRQESSSVADRASATQSHKASSPRRNDISQNNSHKQSRYPRRRESRTRMQTRSSSPAWAASVPNYTSRIFPNSWCDDSESSDDTYVPDSDCIETDTTITEEEFESDTSYEVQVPKSTADLLNEYGSNDSDESWEVGMG